MLRLILTTLLFSTIDAQEADLYEKREALKNQFITDMDELKAEAIRLRDENIYNFYDDTEEERHREFMLQIDLHYMQLFKDIERGRFDKEL